MWCYLNGIMIDAFASPPPSLVSSVSERKSDCLNVIKNIKYYILLFLYKKRGEDNEGRFLKKEDKLIQEIKKN